MNIGTIRPNAQGQLTGEINTLKLSVVIFLVAVTSTAERAPKYEIRARAPNGTAVQIGALWEQAARSSGEVFLQGRIDDISLKEPLQIAAFRQDDKSFNIVWQPARRIQAADPFAVAANTETDNAFAEAA